MIRSILIGVALLIAMTTQAPAQRCSPADIFFVECQSAAKHHIKKVIHRRAHRKDTHPTKAAPVPQKMKEEKSPIFDPDYDSLSDALHRCGQEWEGRQHVIH